MDIAAAVAEVGTKKKPVGRPRKQCEVVPTDIQGVVQAPSVPGNVFEMVYNNPQMFKKLFSLYRQYSVGEIKINISEDCLKIVSMDHMQKSNINAKIDGSCVNLYYCARPYTISIKREDLDIVFSSLEKTHYKISFYLTAADYRSKLNIIIMDREYDSETQWSINIDHVNEPVAGPPADNDELYPVVWTFSAAHFKKKVAILRRLGDKMTIQKRGDNPLELTHDESKRASATELYKNNDSIRLQSGILNYDIFTVSVFLVYIHPFVSSNLGNDVTIAADKFKKLSLTTFLDKQPNDKWTVTIKIFTEIYRYEDNRQYQ